MRKRMVRKIDKSTGEITALLPKGLWSPMPIPAYQVLGKANEHTAQRVLCCLISHLGDKGWLVHPSYTRIAKLCGVSRSSIRPALGVLEEYGFIKTVRIQEQQKKKVNRYYIQMSCYDTNLMDKNARAYLPKPARCLGCAKRISHGDYKNGPNGPIHIGCGSSVLTLQKKSNKLPETTVS
jgi:hypothetical protein